MKTMTYELVFSIVRSEYSSGLASLWAPVSGLRHDRSW
jgi:hypothetical protein